MPNKQEVVRKIASLYSTNPEDPSTHLSKSEALILINFDIKLRGELNRKFIAASAALTRDLELKSGLASQTAEAAKEGLAAIPLIGNLLALLGFGAQKAAKYKETKDSLAEYQSLTDLNPTSDPSEFASFTKKLSANIIHGLKDQILGEAKSGKDQAASKKLVNNFAIEISKRLLAHIKEGNCAGMTTDFDEKSLITNLSNAVGARKEQALEVEEELAFSTTESEKFQTSSRVQGAIASQLDPRSNSISSPAA